MKWDDLKKEVLKHLLEDALEEMGEELTEWNVEDLVESQMTYTDEERFASFAHLFGMTDEEATEMAREVIESNSRKIDSYRDSWIDGEEQAEHEAYMRRRLP